MLAAGWNTVLPTIAVQVGAATVILAALAGVWRWAKPRLKGELVEMIDERIEAAITAKLLEPNGGKSNADIAAKLDTLAARFDDHLVYHRAEP